MQPWERRAETCEQKRLRHDAEETAAADDLEAFNAEKVGRSVASKRGKPRSILGLTGYSMFRFELNFIVELLSFIFEIFILNLIFVDK